MSAPAIHKAAVRSRWTRRHFLSLAKRVAGLCAFAQPLRALSQAVGTESGKSVSKTLYPSVWRKAPRKSVPAWATPGRVRFARWDGGALEVAKASLSGWPQFTPLQPQYVDSMAGWYDPRTIKLLQRAHINLIWVTFSNGFANQTERQQQQQLREYVRLCHAIGIRVMAYESLTNMFFEDMFEKEPDSKNWLSHDKDGKPVSYGAADYQRAGHVSRYLADLSKPAWQAYLRGRIDLAIDAGADGIMYDNCAGEGLLKTFEGLLDYALHKKSDLLVMANFHREQFVYNRMLNAMTTEEGYEAGVFTNADIEAAHNRWTRERGTMLAIGDSFLVNNLGRLRVFKALSEGWKPMMAENRIRRLPGMAESHIMSPQSQRLVMAENLAFNSAYEPSVEIVWAQGLWTGNPEAEAAWDVVTAYNAFAEANERFYVSAQTVAVIAVVLDNHSDGIELLNGLCARNLQYEVLYEDQLSPLVLSRFSVVAAPTMVMASKASLHALADFVLRGGRLFITPATATRDSAAQPSVRPAWLHTLSSESRVTQWDDPLDIGVMAAQLTHAAGSPHIEVNPPPTLLYSIAEQPLEKRVMIHLIHYQTGPSAPCSLKILGLPAKITALSPDNTKSALHISSSGGQTILRLPSVETYTLIVCEGLTLRSP